MSHREREFREWCESNDGEVTDPIGGGSGCVFGESGANRHGRAQPGSTGVLFKPSDQYENSGANSSVIVRESCSLTFDLLVETDSEDRFSFERDSVRVDGEQIFSTRDMITGGCDEETWGAERHVRFD